MLASNRPAYNSNPIINNEFCNLDALRTNIKSQKSPIIQPAHQLNSPKLY
jgi:hypothetical protein